MKKLYFSLRTITRTIIYVSLVAIFLFLVEGCKKKTTWPEPDFILSYQTSQGTYNQISQYRWGKNEDHQLIPEANVSWTNTPNRDSFLLDYTSYLKDKSGRPIIGIVIRKNFLSNQLDFPQSGPPVVKNSDDFYNIFKTGKVSISANGQEGLNCTLHDSTLYLLQAFGPAYLDTANYFEITTANQDVDFSSLHVQNIISTNSYRALMVTINFKCKLFNSSLPTDSLILSNGVFQGYFIDR